MRSEAFLSGVGQKCILGQGERHTDFHKGGWVDVWTSDIIFQIGTGGIFYSTHIIHYMLLTVTES